MYELSTAVVAIIVVGVVAAATAAGLVSGRRFGDRPGARESAGAAQAALLGFIALLLAFGLAMAVGRYEKRRAAVADEANAIGTTYLRAQTLAEPQRSQSLELLSRYTDLRIGLSHAVPEGSAYERFASESGSVQRDLWTLAGQALAKAPTDTAPRLYVESLNQMIDMHTTRLAALADTIPDPVLLMQLFGSAAALGALGAYLGIVGRNATTAVLAAAMVSVILLVIIDLDRPVRGLITVPTTPLENLRTSIALGPAAR